jgi:hypothetical protein
VFFQILTANSFLAFIINAFHEAVPIFPHEDGNVGHAIFKGDASLVFVTGKEPCAMQKVEYRADVFWLISPQAFFMPIFFLLYEFIEKDMLPRDDLELFGANRNGDESTSFKFMEAFPQDLPTCVVMIFRILLLEMKKVDARRSLKEKGVISE